MHFHQMVRRFEAQAEKGLVYRLAAGATIERLLEAESRLGLKFPEQVAGFWRAFDGLEVDEPPFKILSLSEMRRENGMLTFCSCDRNVRIAFDVRAQNQAGQWSIINIDTNYCITLTMASFWSVHMWSWIIKRRPVWHEVHHSQEMG